MSLAAWSNSTERLISLIGMPSTDTPSPSILILEVGGDAEPGVGADGNLPAGVRSRGSGMNRSRRASATAVRGLTAGRAANST
jgi:hypothetical protein